MRMFHEVGALLVYGTKPATDAVTGP